MKSSNINEIILITGGAGFIGSNLCNHFSAKGHTVICVDNLSGGYKENLDSNKNIIFIKGSCADTKTLDKAFSLNPSIVLHLAARKGFNYTSVTNPIEDLKTNTVSTLKLLEYSVKFKINKFIYTSSSCVYGNISKRSNESSKIILDTPYAISKYTSEEYCKFFQRYYNLDITIFRLFNTYGPGERVKKYSNVICRFYQNSINNADINITGKKTTRSYMYIDDLIRAFKISIYKKNLINETLNLGNDIETSINDLAKLVIKNSKSKSRIIENDFRKWDKVINRSTSIEKIYQISGWRPRIKIQTGLKKYYKWFKVHCV
jgi:UDP-glucose 4-epimerase